jgi:hypothetical protein
MKTRDTSPAFKKFWKVNVPVSKKEIGFMTIEELKQWSFEVWKRSRVSLLEELGEVKHGF